MKRVIGSLVIFVLLLGVLVVFAFLFLNIHVARSQTDSGYTSSTASSGERLPESMQNSPVLSVAVSGEGRFSRALRSALQKQLRGDPYIVDVRLLDTVPDQAVAPYLLVDPGELNILWTPVYARSDLQIKVAFASDGDVSFRGKQPIELTSQAGAVIKLEGDFYVRDVTWGLISRPAYDDLLARRTAEEIERALDPAFQPK